MAIYIYQQIGWPEFTWDNATIFPLLSSVNYSQGKLIGFMTSLEFHLRSEAYLETLTQDVLKSSEIEGEHLDSDQVRSSIARRLGIDIAGLTSTDRHVDGIVDMMLDATQNFQLALTVERLFDWHAALFPTGRSGMFRIVTGSWRNNSADDPMQVVSGPMGRETIHFQAPDASRLNKEMELFLNWFQGNNSHDPIIKAAIAHLWFVTIHPFDDGNGRIGRAIMDMQLARADGSPQRFYSMSAQIRKERSDYYNILEQTQKGKLDITGWIEWFLNCLNRAIGATDEILQVVIRKAEFWKRHAAISINNRQRLMLNKLLDGFVGKLTSSKWAKITKCSSDTALRDINDLLSQNILKKEPGGGRSTSYLIKD